MTSDEARRLLGERVTLDATALFTGRVVGVCDEPSLLVEPVDGGPRVLLALSAIKSCEVVGGVDDQERVERIKSAFLPWRCGNSHEVPWFLMPQSGEVCNVAGCDDPQRHPSQHPGDLLDAESMARAALKALRGDEQENR